MLLCLGCNPVVGCNWSRPIESVEPTKELLHQIPTDQMSLLQLQITIGFQLSQQCIIKFGWVHVLKENHFLSYLASEVQMRKFDIRIDKEQIVKHMP